ncbi:MAG: cyclic nucleotide-binding domain-containing protein [Bacteroidia bacterium]
MAITLNFSEFHSACSENRIYQAFNDDERWSLYKLAFKKYFKKGSVVFYSSERNNAEFYIVENGELELNLNSGKEKLYRRGDLFGEISVINGSARMGTMTALYSKRLGMRKPNDLKFGGNEGF